MDQAQKNRQFLWELGFNTIRQLETAQGILASSREEVFGCIFGRDTLITSLKLLKFYKRTNNSELLPIVRKALINLAALQGKEENPESGEQPGKSIHEFRTEKYEHLTKKSVKPWYLYSDQVMRNYDSVDSTPLLLIAVYRYWQYTGDGEFLEILLPNVGAAIDWIFKYGDSNSDGFIDYDIPKRIHGGLVAQNWMDSVEAVFHETEGVLNYPMAPVEVQAYVYLAFRLWADFFQNRDKKLTKKLVKRADELKQLFNKKFICSDPDGHTYLAWKLDGLGQQFKSVRSNMGHCLWASTNLDDDKRVDSILYQDMIFAVAKRLMMPDIFEPDAGVRTLSKFSRNFKPNSYHNGSIWPHDNAIIAEGMKVHGLSKEAGMIKKAVLKAVENFGTPLELFVYIDGQYSEYCSASGQTACRYQAWTAASILDLLTNYDQ
jgi:glycogen debranching enzyme